MWLFVFVCLFVGWLVCGGGAFPVLFCAARTVGPEPQAFVFLLWRRPLLLCLDGSGIVVVLVNTSTWGVLPTPSQVISRIGSC